MLNIKNLTKTYGSKKILDNVSVEVPAGSIALFLGASGVGKSTLLRVLNNLETLDTGLINLDGVNLDPETIHASHISGMVFQQFNLFDHMTVLENITLALEKVAGKLKVEAETIAHKLLKEYGLEKKALAYPSQLSGGQKQRLALIRTIALQPKIICFDEPTSALDPVLTTQVAETIQKLANDGYIVLIATHDTVLIDQLACMIYLMEHGSIVETMSSKNFITQRDKFPKTDAFVSGTKSDN